MINQNSTMSGLKTKISKEELSERIESKLLTRGIANPTSATNDQIYQATVSIIKEFHAKIADLFAVRCLNSLFEFRSVLKHYFLDN